MTTARTALILIDLQHWILEMRAWEPRPASAVVDACARLREGFAAARDSVPGGNGPAAVVLVRFLQADGADGGPEAPANRLHERIAPGPGDLLVTKHGLDAFEGTQLRARLAALGVTEVVIAGLSTAHGVAATARTAMASGYRVTLVSDATATVTDEEQDRVLGRFARAGAAVRTTDEVLSGLPTGG
jgi:nicotinamidase-related amidase